MGELMRQSCSGVQTAVAWLWLRRGLGEGFCAIRFSIKRHWRLDLKLKTVAHVEAGAASSVGEPPGRRPGSQGSARAHGVCRALVPNWLRIGVDSVCVCFSVAREILK